MFRHVSLLPEIIAYRFSVLFDTGKITSLASLCNLSCSPGVCKVQSVI
jgi:hypothetical protein